MLSAMTLLQVHITPQRLRWLAMLLSEEKKEMWKNMQKAVTWKFKKEMTEHCNSCSINGFQHLNWIKWTQDVIQRHSKLLAEYNFQHLLQYW